MDRVGSAMFYADIVLTSRTGFYRHFSAQTHYVLHAVWIHVRAGRSEWLILDWKEILKHYLRYKDVTTACIYTRTT